jgi:hypothetical protein
VPYRGNATTAHIIRQTCLRSMLPPLMGTVELAIVAAVDLGLWLRAHKFAQRI